LNVGEDKIVLAKISKGPHHEYVVWNVDKECNCDTGAYFPVRELKYDINTFEESLDCFRDRTDRAINAVQVPK